MYVEQRLSIHKLLVFIAMTLFSIVSFAQQQLLRGFPDTDPTNGKMVNVSRGFDTLGETPEDDVLNISIRVPASEMNVTIDIFDADTRRILNDTAQGFWDDYAPQNDATIPDEVTFQLFRDPDLIGNTQAVDMIAEQDISMLSLSDTDNVWYPFADMLNDTGAQTIDGDYGYHLVASWNTKILEDIQNHFMVRTNGLAFTLAGSTIGFSGFFSVAGVTDRRIPPPINYDGNWLFAAELRDSGGPNCFIDIYDGDFDRNDDTDDFNTVNDLSFFPFSPSPEALPEGMRPVPSNLGGDDSDFDPVRRSPSVNYTVTGPTGLASQPSYTVVNDNPSGDFEYELFRIASSHPDCIAIGLDPGTIGSENPNYDPLPVFAGRPNEFDPPMAAPDVIIPGLAAGFHFINIQGLDAVNNVFLNVSADIVPADSLFDFGDAPDSYATDNADSGEGVGPRHVTVGGLFLGTNVDGELDGVPTVDASGDDDLGFDDEDGVLGFNPLNVTDAGGIYQVEVQVTNERVDSNNQFLSANLAAWIDFDGSGTFEPAEGIAVVVPGASGVQTVTLDFNLPGVLAAGDTYFRARLTSDPLDANNPTDGPVSTALPASDGEVEDHKLTIQSDDCVPCKGMKTISFEMSHYSYYRDTNEIVRVRVGSLLGQFNNTDLNAPILFEGTVLNGGTINISVPDEHLGKTLTISVEGNHHSTEYGKARFHPDCDLQLLTTSGSSYIKFKVTAFEKNSEETCECVECETGPAKVTFKITNTYGRDQGETIRVRVGNLNGSLGANPDEVANPVIYSGVVNNGQTFMVNIPEEHRGKTLSITVQGNNHTYEYVKAKFDADCDLKVGSFSATNGYLKVKVDDLEGDTGEICPMECPPGSTAGNAKDYFSYKSYSNNNGDRDWSDSWEENDSGGYGATGGNVRIYKGKLKLRKTHSFIEREVDLCGSTDVWLKFKYVMSYKVDPSDKVAVEISPDSGENWHQIDEYTGRHGWTERSYNISQFASANTRVRFRISNYYGGSGEWFYVTWIKISSN